jgi:dTDP-4-amino-4,6-dideoxy-D-galactose acyltransferase
MIEYLEWDSNFFNLKIGRINYFDSAPLTTHLWETIKENIKASHYDLVYFIASSEDFITNSILASQGEILIDRKVTLYCEIDDTKKQIVSDDCIQLLTSKQLTPDLIALSLASGEYSRFKLDENFPEGSFENLYTRWIENSVNKSIADYVIVYQSAEKVVGLLTLALKETYADIGLLAVDLAQRGKGIASHLLSKAFQLSVLHHLPSVRVVTQLDNKVAMALYEKNGFVVKRKEYIYHIWTK